MIYILSWTTKKDEKTLFRLLHSKTFNSRTFQGLPLKCKDFTRLWEPCIVLVDQKPLPEGEPLLTIIV